MSAITIGGDLIHYEKLGRGRPVILVHGWIGSWRYWIPLMQKLHTQFSVYTLDLVGFGDSSKNEANYTIESHVKMLDQFMEQLGIPKAAMVGHGLGAMVLSQFANQHPDRVARALLVSMPLFQPDNIDERKPASTPQLLTPRNDRYSLAPKIEDVLGSDKTFVNTGKVEDKTIVSGTTANSGIYTPFHELPTISRPQQEAAIDRDALRRAAEERDKKKAVANPLMTTFKDAKLLSLLEKCFKKTEPEFEKLKVDVEKSDDKVLSKSAEGFEAGEMLDNLRRMTAPIIAVHGSDDPIFPAPTEKIWDYLTDGKEDVFVPIPLPNVRHFPMLEHDAFARLTTDFLSVPDISKIEMRERWRRRSR